MIKPTALVFLTLFLIVSATPVRQLNDGLEDGITAALESPLPSPSATAVASSSPTPSTLPDTSGANGSPVATPSLSPASSPEIDAPIATPSSAPSASPSPYTEAPESSTPLPNPNIFPGMGSDGDDNGEQPTDDTEEQSNDDGDFKSADTGLAASPGSISAIALVGIALAILAPAVIIYWVVRRRNQATGFENMPEAEENTYRGPGRDTFTVA